MLRNVTSRYLSVVCCACLLDTGFDGFGTVVDQQPSGFAVPLVLVLIVVDLMSLDIMVVEKRKVQVPYSPPSIYVYRLVHVASETQQQIHHGRVT